MNAHEINELIYTSNIDTDSISDGHHTFGQLYHQRAMLFATICKLNRDKAWKAYKHFDGEIWDGFFIVGITTPEGNYTYHYKNELWDVFDVQELDHAPEYDGHTEADVTRLFSLAGLDHDLLTQTYYTNLE